jgi:hypothetical protein
MINTKLALSLLHLNQDDANLLTRIVEMPYKLAVGEEIDIDGELMLAKVESVRLSLADMLYHVRLSDIVYAHELQRDDESAALVKAGWEDAVRTRTYRANSMG